MAPRSLRPRGAIPARRAGAAACLVAGLLWVGFVAHCWRASGPRLEPPTVQVRDRHGVFLGEIGEQADERLGFWRVEAVPERVAAATLALEDRRFWRHPGVDPVAVVRALGQNLRAGTRVSGASTLAMQVARLQSPGPRTWARKATEAVTAVLLVDRVGREAVLRRYLTLAPYGNNVHGIAYAARRYFDKPVEDLSWAETALLVSVPQAPGAHNLYRAAGRRAAADRARTVLGWLREQGALDEAEHLQALRELVGWEPPPRAVRPPAAMHPLLALEAELPVVRDGGIVTSTVDLVLQERVQLVLQGAVERWSSRGAGNAAAVVVDLESRALVVQVGSTDWADAARKGAIDFSRTPRSPGSTLKPFLYALALQQGRITPGSVLDDLARGADGIGNADARFLGPLLPRQALANSRNVPAVALAGSVGLDVLYGQLADLGLHDHALPASHYGLGMAIGAMPTTLVDLAAAYTALATDGVWRPLELIRGAPQRPGRSVISPAAARWVGLALSDPMARLPTFPRLGHSEYPFGVAVKTGTSADYRDAWTFAWSQRWLVGVWIGHPDWRPMQGLSGYRAAASVAHEIFDLVRPAHQGLSDVGLPAPQGWAPVVVCPWSGGRAQPGCPSALTEWFPPGQAPSHDCTVHRRVGGRVVARLPPRYAAWLGEPTAVAASELPATLAIVAPVQGAELIRDPEVPRDRATVRLAVRVEPAVAEVVWYVDGLPFAVVSPPYEARWPLADGAHTFEVGLPYRPERSPAVSIITRSTPDPPGR